MIGSCADPVINAFATALQHSASFARWREELRAYDATIRNARTTERAASRRKFMCSDWKTRVLAPMSLDYLATTWPVTKSTASKWATCLINTTAITDPASERHALWTAELAAIDGANEAAVHSRHSGPGSPKAVAWATLTGIATHAALHHHSSTNDPASAGSSAATTANAFVQYALNLAAIQTPAGTRQKHDAYATAVAIVTRARTDVFARAVWNGCLGLLDDLIGVPDLH